MPRAPWQQGRGTTSYRRRARRSGCGHSGVEAPHQGSRARARPHEAAPQATFEAQPQARVGSCPSYSLFRPSWPIAIGASPERPDGVCVGGRRVVAAAPARGAGSSLGRAAVLKRPVPGVPRRERVGRARPRVDGAQPRAVHAARRAHVGVAKAGRRGLEAPRGRARGGTPGVRGRCAAALLGRGGGVGGGGAGVKQRALARGPRVGAGVW
ncbi:MAG: hypothetical protein J3K34DRAFT_438402 [Monoraphidium minutum]|nr:MAG: hypothetical protein J3K34DRAFT_438402 [Monoraphidium minutum]